MYGDGILTYAALKMKDLAMSSYATEKRNFHTKNGITEVDFAAFGKADAGARIRYFDGENYIAFTYRNNATELMIVLPDEGVSLESVPLNEAYTEIVKIKNTNKSAYGYIPYFHLGSGSIDLTPSFTNFMNGNELLWSGLLANGGLTANILDFYVLQSSDFEFCDKGIFGETVIATGGSSAMPPSAKLFIDVNRPFYALCLQDNFPLFVNKVNDPGLSTSIK